MADKKSSDLPPGLVRVTVATKWRSYFAGQEVAVPQAEVEREMLKSRPCFSMTSARPEVVDELSLIEGLSREDELALYARGIYFFSQLARSTSYESAVLAGFVSSDSRREAARMLALRHWREEVEGGGGLDAAVGRLLGKAIGLDLAALEAMSDEELEAHGEQIAAAYRGKLGRRPGKRGARTMLGEIAAADRSG